MTIEKTCRVLLLPSTTSIHHTTPCITHFTPLPTHFPHRTLKPPAGKSIILSRLPRTPLPKRTTTQSSTTTARPHSLFHTQRGVCPSRPTHTLGRPMAACLTLRASVYIEPIYLGTMRCERALSQTEGRSHQMDTIPSLRGEFLRFRVVSFCIPVLVSCLSLPLTIGLTTPFLSSIAVHSPLSLVLFASSSTSLF